MMTRKEACEHLLDKTQEAIERCKKAVAEHPEEKTLKLTLESLYSRRRDLEERLTKNKLERWCV